MAGYSERFNKHSRVLKMRISVTLCVHAFAERRRMWSGCQEDSSSAYLNQAKQVPSEKKEPQLLIDYTYLHPHFVMAGNVCFAQV